VVPVIRVLRVRLKLFTNFWESQVIHIEIKSVQIIFTEPGTMTHMVDGVDMNASTRGGGNFVVHMAMGSTVFMSEIKYNVAQRQLRHTYCWWGIC
jgi:uncharacterized protein (AIM24 family)